MSILMFQIVLLSGQPLRHLQHGSSAATSGARLSRARRRDPSIDWGSEIISDDIEPQL